jgi:O-succinylhomoserine sulfhydrylase
MSAVFNALVALLEAGDRVVAARGLFGSCFAILDELLPRWGISTDFVDGTDLDQWEAALRQPTKAVFFATPSNPMQDLIDVAAVSELAHRAGASVVVDNVFATPVLQRPVDLGADVVVYSTTKHIDGHGRTLGGIICGTRQFIDEQLQPLMRHTGPSLSPFNAWVLVKSLEVVVLSSLGQAQHLILSDSGAKGHPQLVANACGWRTQDGFRGEVLGSAGGGSSSPDSGSSLSFCAVVSCLCFGGAVPL